MDQRHSAIRRMLEPMKGKTGARAGAILLVAAAVALAQAAWASGSAVNVKNAPARMHPKSGAIIRTLASPDAQKTRSAFVAHMTIKAGAQVPEHRDPTEEYLYVLGG